MKVSDLQLVVISRLEDMANQVEHHVLNGDHDLAELIRWEALDIAGAFDCDETFFFVNGMTSK
jgi:hypothetical protein